MARKLTPNANVEFRWVLILQLCYLLTSKGCAKTECFFRGEFPSSHYALPVSYTHLTLPTIYSV